MGSPKGGAIPIARVARGRLAGIRRAEPIELLGRVWNSVWEAPKRIERIVLCKELRIRRHHLAVWTAGDSLILREVLLRVRPQLGIKATGSDLLSLVVRRKILRGLVLDVEWRGRSRIERTMKQVLWRDRVLRV